MRLEVCSVKNGFIVHERVQDNSCISDDSIMVFGTFEDLEKYLREYFGPLIEITK